MQRGNFAADRGRALLCLQISSANQLSKSPVQIVAHMRLFRRMKVCILLDNICRAARATYAGWPASKQSSKQLGKVGSRVAKKIAQAVTPASGKDIA
jgi:hypothetical protein